MGDFSLDLKSLVAIIALIATITIGYLTWRRTHKSLSYDIIANSPLLTANEEIREKLQILYEGKSVKNVHLFILKVINDGKQPIDEKDFKKTLDFVFSKEAQILSAEVVSVKPDNLEVSISSEKNKVHINPILLNNKDSIEIKIIVSTYENGVQCDARIVGIREIKPFIETRLKLTIVGLIVVFVSTSLFALLVITGRDSLFEMNVYSRIGIVLLGLVIIPLLIDRVVHKIFNK